MFPVPPPGHPWAWECPCLCPGDQVPRKDHTAFCEVETCPGAPPNDNDWVGQELPRNYQALCLPTGGWQAGPGLKEGTEEGGGGEVGGV